MTHYADHVEKFSHDSIRRLLKREKMSAGIVWEHVRGNVVSSPRGCVVFDDTVLDKDYSHKIELVRRQYSGNAHGLVKGIGMVNCLYVNPDTGQYWIIDYRIFDPDGDGKTKLDHVREMLLALCASKGLPCDRVLMDSWYATKELMLFIESLGKIYYCPIKSNRLVDDSDGESPYRSVDQLEWNQAQLKQGKLVKLHKFPQKAPRETIPA